MVVQTQRLFAFRVGRLASFVLLAVIAAVMATEETPVRKSRFHIPSWLSFPRKKTASDPKTEATPQTKATPHKKTALQKKATPQEKTRPQTKAIPQTMVTPQKKTVPQTAAIPHAEPTPQIAATPQTNAIPQMETSPQTNAIPKAAPISQIETTPQTAPISQIETMPQMETTPQTAATPEAFLATPQASATPQTAASPQGAPISQIGTTPQTNAMPQTEMTPQTKPPPPPPPPKPKKKVVFRKQLTLKERTQMLDRKYYWRERQPRIPYKDPELGELCDKFAAQVLARYENKKKGIAEPRDTDYEEEEAFRQTIVDENFDEKFEKLTEQVKKEKEQKKAMEKAMKKAIKKAMKNKEPIPEFKEVLELNKHTTEDVPFTQQEVDAIVEAYQKRKETLTDNSDKGHFNLEPPGVQERLVPPYWDKEWWKRKHEILWAEFVKPTPRPKKLRVYLREAEKAEEERKRNELEEACN